MRNMISTVVRTALAGGVLMGGLGVAHAVTVPFGPPQDLSGIPAHGLPAFEEGHVQLSLTAIRLPGNQTYHGSNFVFDLHEAGSGTLYWQPSPKTSNNAIATTGASTLDAFFDVNASLIPDGTTIAGHTYNDQLTITGNAPIGGQPFNPPKSLWAVPLTKFTAGVFGSWSNPNIELGFQTGNPRNPNGSTGSQNIWAFPYWSGGAESVYLYNLGFSDWAKLFSGWNETKGGTIVSGVFANLYATVPLPAGLPLLGSGLLSLLGLLRRRAVI
jgi:hypothetical protein